MGNDNWDDESNVDYSDPKSVEKFLEHNLREGYLSDEEQEFVDNLVDRLDSSPKLDEVQEKLRDVQINEVEN